MKVKKIQPEISEEQIKASKKRKPGYVRKTSARGADKRTRTVTLRPDLYTELIIFACSIGDQKDVAEFITTLLEKFVGTQPQKARINKLKTMAAANNKDLESFLREMLEMRFSKIDFNWDEISAIEMLGLD